MTWRIEQTGGTTIACNIWGSGANDIYVIGEAQVLHGDGGNRGCTQALDSPVGAARTG